MHEAPFACDWTPAEVKFSPHINRVLIYKFVTVASYSEYLGFSFRSIVTAGNAAHIQRSTKSRLNSWAVLSPSGYFDTGRQQNTSTREDAEEKRSQHRPNENKMRHDPGERKWQLFSYSS